MKLKNAASPVLNVMLAESHLFRREHRESYGEEMQLLSDGKEIPQSSQLYILSPVLDFNGVLRMKSRLVGVEENLRFPVILHSKNELTALLLNFYHQRFSHAGEDLIRNEVRQRFWIPRLRSAIRNEIRGCLFCRKRKVMGQTPEMGTLPDFRSQPQPRAFWICGVDYFGPMEVTVKRHHEKRYGVLFTCMNTRAVYLEIAHSLTTDSCIMAIRRMVARRGNPAEMWSNNGLNLRGADRELREALAEVDQEQMDNELSIKGIKWNFIPPTAAHMGGTWERLVRSVKTTFGVILKSRPPRDEVLRTIFAEAEAIVNSRPLTDVPADPESHEALTPFHFLIGTSSVNAPPCNFENDLSLQKQWRKAQALADMFWMRWVKEYLSTLQRRTKWHGKRLLLAVGDVVVLDASLKRNTWPLGLVTQIFPGKDNIVRVAEVKTSSGFYRRPVTKLGKLDVMAEPQE